MATDRTRSVGLLQEPDALRTVVVKTHLCLTAAGLHIIMKKKCVWEADQVK